jgi:hypothetical protein
MGNFLSKNKKLYYLLFKNIIEYVEDIKIILEKCKLIHNDIKDGRVDDLQALLNNLNEIEDRLKRIHCLGVLIHHKDIDK